MKPIGIIPDRLLHGSWNDNYYVMYSGTTLPSISLPIFNRLIRRTLLITDIQ